MKHSGIRGQYNPGFLFCNFSLLPDILFFSFFFTSPIDKKHKIEYNENKDGN